MIRILSLPQWAGVSGIATLVGVLIAVIAMCGTNSSTPTADSLGDPTSQHPQGSSVAPTATPTGVDNPTGETPSPQSSVIRLVASPEEVRLRGQLAVAVEVAGAQVGSNDWVGLYEVGTLDHDPITSERTGGRTSGSMSFTVPIKPGSYEFRYFAAGQDQAMAQSNAIVVTLPTSSDITLVASPREAHIGEPVGVEVEVRGLAVGSNDLVGLYEVDALDRDSITSQVTGGITKGSMRFTAPAKPGSYEFRYLIAGLDQAVAKSNTIDVTQP